MKLSMQKSDIKSLNKKQTSNMLKKVLFTITLCLLALFTSQAQSTDKIQSFLDLEFNLNNNETLKIAELKGKVILFDFWHRGCYPCLKAIPDLIDLQEEFKEDLVIIGVNDYDILEDVSAHFEYKQVNYFSTYKTNDRIFRLLDVQVFPTTLLLDAEGEIIYRDEGYSKAGIRKLRRTILKALK